MPVSEAARYKLNVYREHGRDWQSNAYVYPVISRRSGGLSIGINLNPDMACNFDCIYCQVDRTLPVRVRSVDIDVLRDELDDMIGQAGSGALFEHPRFEGVDDSLKRICDLAFSGDGEPTTCPVFAEAVTVAAELKSRHGLTDAKIALITDACYLTRPEVVRGLEIMDENNGEIWAKLDAGTQGYYELINKPNVPLTRVIENIIAVARQRPIRIQSLFMRVHGKPPADGEIDAFVDRLHEIVDAGGQIMEVQVYTVARRPAQDYVSSLTEQELEHIAQKVRSRTRLVARVYGGA